MSIRKPSSTVGTGRRPAADLSGKSGSWGVVSQATAKIKHEPFLFVIAVIALLIALAAVASRLGSPDLRLIIIVVAVLAFVVIAGHFLMAGLQSTRTEVQELVTASVPSAGSESLKQRKSPAVESKGTPAVQSRKPWSAPLVPRLFIGRDQCLRELKQRLGSSDGKARTFSMEPLTVIRGTPGVGKTTVAAALAHDPEVEKAFPDGIVWTSLGQNVRMLFALAPWGRAFGSDALSRAATLDDAIVALRELLLEKRALLIADDVWKSEHGVPFLRARGENCAVILTTRMSFDVSGLTDTNPGAIYNLPTLTQEHAFELLAAIAPEVCTQFARQTRQLVKQLGSLPLSILVAGRLLNAGYTRGWSVSDLLAELSDESAGGSKLLNAQVPSDHISSDQIELGDTETATVEALLKKSTDHLDERTRDCFADLGSFPPAPVTFNLAAMQGVWELNNAVEAQAIADTLIDHGLLEPVGYGAFQVHALLAAHARSLRTGRKFGEAHG
jgi:hypothetical protein